MAYDDWDPEIQEVYDSAVAFTWLAESENEQDHYTAEQLFEYGWVYDAGRNNPEVRETFYDYTGTDERDIDWDSWREYWGYDS